MNGNMQGVKGELSGEDGVLKILYLGVPPSRKAQVVFGSLPRNIPITGG